MPVTPKLETERFVAERFEAKKFVELPLVKLRPASETVRMIVDEAIKANVSVAVWMIPVFSSPENAKAAVEVFPYPSTRRELETCPFNWIVLPVALPKLNDPTVPDPIVAEFAFNVVDVTAPAVIVPVTPSDEAVALASVVLPVTFNVPATFKVPVTLEDAATNPPKNSAVVVVNDPRAITDCNVSRPTAAQFVPFARQTAIPPTKRLVVVTVVAESVPTFNALPVAFPKVSVPIEPIFELIELPVAEVKVRRPVAARLVAVVFASVEEPVTISVPPFKEPMVARLIFTDVPDAVVNPSELVKSDVEVTPTSVVLPVTFNVPATFKVPVTELDAATKPPRSSSVVVVKFPRAVTVASVSESTVPAGQPTPLERQTAKPMTVAVAKFPEFAIIVVPLAVLNPSEPANNDVDVTPASVEEPVTTNVPPFNAPTLAVLIFALVPEAAVKPKEFVNSDVEVTPTKVALPVTLNVPATFKVPVTLEDAATNPPKNSAVVVVNDPRAITDCNVSIPTAAQFVPFARQTAIPPTKRLVVVTVVAESVPTFNALPVAFPKVSVPIEPIFELIELPVAEVKVRFSIVPLVASRFVVVTEIALIEVIVPFVETRFVIVPLGAVIRFVSARIVPVPFVKLNVCKLL
jgi:hypothetical protein